jgi:hypothetical protein
MLPLYPVYKLLSTTILVNLQKKYRRLASSNYRFIEIVITKIKQPVKTATAEPIATPLILKPIYLSCLRANEKL